MELSQRWTPDVIREKISTDNRWLFRAILAIHARQTADEQRSRDTLYRNGCGFNKADARFFCTIAQMLRYGQSLNALTVETCRTRMCKYSAQLARIANAKVAR